MGNDLSRTEALVRALERYRGQRGFVAVLGSPDPDGLASAWALKVLARHAGLEMDILTFEEISRPDNHRFVQLLDIEFLAVREAFPRRSYRTYAVVDRQNARLPVPFPRKLPLVAHIDHHSPTPTPALFRQQDVSVGSTSSLMAVHLQWLVEQAPQDPSEMCRLSTALLCGIRTDTLDFVTAGPADLRAAAFLSMHASPEMTRAIVETPLAPSFLETLAHAIGHKRLDEGFLVAWAGRLGVQNRDVIGQTADFLARMAGVRTVVVVGLVSGNFVGSLRSKDPDLDPYAFLDEALASRVGRPVDCGGRTFSGGFSVPASRLEGSGEEGGFRILEEALHQGWSRRVAPLRRRPARSPRRRKES
ncbi:hypothetical protein KBD49_01960 [Myxococcota bacterium]|nr:hypothetical protein [Myxococcota bacterium]